MNFDGSIRGAMDSVGHVIRDLDCMLLAVKGFFLFEPLVLEVELKVAWMDITCITSEL